MEKHLLSKRITLIEGNSTDMRTLATCRSILRNKKNVLVVLDSHHSKDHVLQELLLYSEFVTRGNYVVVMDSTKYYMAKSGYSKEYWLDGKNWLTDTPKHAIDEFLAKNKILQRDIIMKNFTLRLQSEVF